MRKTKAFSALLILLIVLGTFLPGVSLAQVTPAQDPVKETKKEVTTKQTPSGTTVTTKTETKTITPKATGSKRRPRSRTSRTITAQRRTIQRQQREINRLRRSRTITGGTTTVSITKEQMDSIATAVSANVKSTLGNLKLSDPDMAEIKKAIREEVAAQFAAGRGSSGVTLKASETTSTTTTTTASSQTWDDLWKYHRDTWVVYTVFPLMLLLSFLFPGLWTWTIQNWFLAFLAQLLIALLIFLVARWLFVELPRLIKDRPVVGQKVVKTTRLKAGASETSPSPDDWEEVSEPVDIRQPIWITIIRGIPKIVTISRRTV